VWSTTGGEIDDAGVFLAGRDKGSFTVTATSEDVSGMATCIIGKEATPPPPPPPEKKKMVWTGEVPAQKWMNFYTKILSKHASGGGMKIALNVEIVPEGGLSPQKIEETKSALRELGLSDAVEVE
jgi:hypothetical protein